MDLLIGCARKESLQRAEALARERGCFVLGGCLDGRQLLEQARRERPDALLCELVLPLLDGAAVLSRLGELALPGAPALVLCAPRGMDRGSLPLAGALVGEGWEEAFACLDLVGRRQIDGPTARRMAERLQEMGFSTHLRGREYIERALCLCLQDGERLRDLRARVYGPIAREKGVRPESVERDIRYAIEHAWRYGKLSALHLFFGYTVPPEKGKPGNRAFLAQMTEAIKREGK